MITVEIALAVGAGADEDVLSVVHMMVVAVPQAAIVPVAALIGSLDREIGHCIVDRQLEQWKHS